MNNSQRPTKYAALYCRVSSDEQVENFSLETQERLCRELAEREGYTIHPEGIISDDGFSGYVLERQGLIQLRELVQNRAIQAIIVKKLDRLSRKAWHRGMLREEFAHAGIRLLSVDEPFLSQESNPEADMMHGFSGSVDEYYRANLLREAMRGRLARANHGYPSGGIVSLGY